MADKTKRKHKTLSLAKKCEILQKLDKGETSAQLVREYNVGKATIYDIKKNRTKIETFMKNAGLDANTRCTLKLSEYRLMEDVLFSWFLEERRHNRDLSEKAIRKKSLHFYKEIYKNDNFKASDGWFQNFKNRYGIKGLYEPVRRMNAVKLNELSNDSKSVTGEGSLVNFSKPIVSEDKVFDIPVVTKTEPLEETEYKSNSEDYIEQEVLTGNGSAESSSNSQAETEDTTGSDSSSADDDTSIYVTHLKTRLDNLNYQQKFIAQKLISDVMMLAETSQLHLTSAIVNKSKKKLSSNASRGSDPLSS